MAASSQAIDTDVIVTCVAGTANLASDVNTSVSEIVTKFNAMLETVTGHSHDGTDSAPVVTTGFSSEDLLIGSFIGLFGGGRY